ncbi:FliM/FliN family flagellar motor switch protein [Shewanella frigidimarina]|uniref:FliM/FliN family flagellar motor switch protein n=1 Tax=Shewanella frigidimarina TaxID=56812 RepID=UPI003D7BA66D
MKVTARAFLLKANSKHEVKPVKLVQETLVRSRILKKLSQFKRPILDAVSRLFMPITRQGYASLWNVSLTTCNNSVESQPHFGWFACRYQQKTLAWWRIDRCTLEQLASCYYGSLMTPLSSPLRQPTQSEFRLIKRLFTHVFEILPFEDIDLEELEIELVKSHSPIEASAVWALEFASDSVAPPLQIYMAQELLLRVKDTPNQKPDTDHLAAKLAQWLQQVPIKMKLTLGHQNIPIDSLNKLKVGDILPINLYPKSILTVGTGSLFNASVHSHDGQMVAKLTQDTYHYEDKKIG